MSERKRTRWTNKWTCLAATLVLALIGSGFVLAEPQGQKKPATPAQPAKTGQGKSGSSDGPAKADTNTSAGTATTGNIPPVVARVNNEEITFKALAEEVIARNGAEVLETMISRLLVDQAVRQQGIKITAQEIDEEIRRTADRMGMPPEQFLKMLKEKRNLDEEHYVRDIVLPGLALKKMARPAVKVTDEDVQKAFEAKYGEKVKCRWLMHNELQTTMKIWNELKTSSEKSSDGRIPLAEFEYQVQHWSIDPETRTLGGQLQPISRHTSPAFKAIEDAAFAMKEDGDITKVLQFGGAYVILYRETRMPAQDVELSQPVRNELEGWIYEAKMADQIGQIFAMIQKNAKIENNLTGEVHRPQKDVVPAEHSENTKQQPAKSAAKDDTQKKTATPAKK